MRALVPGRARGEVVALSEGLSFWGGFDPQTGRVIDRSHPQFGEVLTGMVVYMPHGRGSSSSSSVLAESIRLGTAPAALLLGEPDSILVIGARVAEMLYGRTLPIYLIEEAVSSGLVMEIGE